MKIALLALAAVLAASPALARQDHSAHGAAHPAGHATMLKASSPTNGAVVRGSPRALSLTFAHPMTLKAVALTGPDGRTVPVRLAAAAPRAETSVPLPKLAPGAWRAVYKAEGADGHAMTGLVRFTVR